MKEKPIYAVSVEEVEQSYNEPTAENTNAVREDKNSAPYGTANLTILKHIKHKKAIAYYHKFMLSLKNSRKDIDKKNQLSKTYKLLRKV